jgi:hypothetical protein
MNIPVRIGMDTSKSVFQPHGVDENEVVVVRRQFRRAEMIRYFERLPPVLVAIESLRQLAPLGPPAAVVWARGKANPDSVCEGHVGADHVVREGPWHHRDQSMRTRRPSLRSRP